MARDTTPFLFLLAVLPCFASPLLEPFTYSENFENGSVGAWSSYPPAQDVAYDPTIWVKPLACEKAKDRALYREITPTYENDCLFGVRKKADLFLDGKSAISFRCFFKGNRAPEAVILKLGFADSGSAEKKVRLSRMSSWENCRVPLGEYAKKGRPRRLSGFAILAYCPKADPENLLRFGVDDVRLNGLRPVSCEFLRPRAHALSEWPDRIAAVHFREGRGLAFECVFPFRAASAAVSLQQPFTGKDGGVHSMQPAAAGSWTFELPSGVPAGLWRATVSGAKGRDTASTGLVFLVTPRNAPSGHPRLFFSEGEKKKVLEKISKGRLADAWSKTQEDARKKREQYDPAVFNYNLDAYDEVHWLPTYVGYVKAIRTPAEFIRANAVVYALSGDPEAGEAARKGLLAMASWPAYVHPHILNQGQFTYWPVGLVLIDLALGFDMVYDRLTPEERKRVARALYAKGVTEVYKEYVRDNRVSSNTSNWISHVCGGGILSAIAAAGEIPEEELEPFLTGMILKTGELVERTFDPDGSYGEGYSYHDFTLQTLGEILPAAEKNLGVVFPEKVAKSHEYLLYQMNASRQKVYDFGDTGDRLETMTHFASLIGKYRDPRLLWLYGLAPETGDRDLFFLDESVPSKGPSGLPLARHFRGTGTAVFRSGFQGDDFMIVFRCGPFCNHQHFDQGAFFLSDKGEDFLTEMGKTGYYDDPWYQKLAIQPAGHNCVLINGDPESQRAGDIAGDVSGWKEHAFITDFLDFEGGAFVSGRLDPLYKGKVKTLRRSLFYLKPRTVILIDEAVGTESTASMQLCFHAPFKGDIRVEGAKAVIARPGGSLTLLTVAPESYDATIEKRPLTLAEFRKENALTMKPRGLLNLSCPVAGRGGRAVFVNVLSTDPALAESLKTQRTPDHVRLDAGGKSFLVNTSVEKGYADGAVATDALVFSGGAAGFAALRLTRLSLDGKIRLSAEKHISLAFKDGAEKELRFSAQEETAVSLAISARPEKVLLDGRVFSDWGYDAAKGLSMKLPAGTGMVVIQ